MVFLILFVQLVNSYVMLAKNGNTVEMFFQKQWNSTRDRFVLDVQFNSAVTFADTTYSSIVCLELTNNKSLRAGDFGYYYQITQKTDMEDMEIQILFVQA